MFRSLKVFILLFLTVMLALSACSLGGATTPTTDANAIYTAAAETVGVELTRSVNLTPSLTATSTVADTATLAPTTSVPTDMTPVGTTPAFTATIAPTMTLPSSPDKAEYVSQAIADGTSFNAGDAIKMTWKIKNVGTTTWTTAYTAKFFAGDQMGAPASVAFSTSVKPGATLDIVVNFVAPSAAGAKRSIWVVQNPDGVNFYNFYVDIKVIGATATKVPPTATKAPAATQTFTPQPTATVTVTEAATATTPYPN